MKWLLLLIVLAVFVFWLARGRKMRSVSRTGAKEIEQRRYYVQPPDENEPPPDDHEGNRF
ncbi:hypothetical protein QQM79_12665 [Marinobacteraceae bacterium S3BR75-40.1]